MDLGGRVLGGPVSRREIALGPAVWFMLTATFAAFAVATACVAFILPGVDRTLMLVFSAALAVETAVLTRMQPPRPGAKRIHVVLATTYIGPAFALCAFAPAGSAAIASAMFFGPLTAVWVIRRRSVIAHYVAASIVLFIPSMLGLVDAGTFVACIALVPAVWALGGCCVVLLDAAEADGRKLERLVQRDPLTGVGNRRLLDEQLEFELGRHASRHLPLSLLTLDLNGFKALNDTVGHAAGDELLVLVAEAIVGSVRRRDTVVRQGGDEFCVILPGTAPRQAEAIAAEIRAALSRIDRFGHGLSAGIGCASYPADAADAVGLLDAADVRLLADKAAGRGSRPSWSAARALPGPEQPSDAAKPAAAGDRTQAAASVRASTFGSSVSRETLATNRFVWSANGLMYLFFAAVGTGVATWAPELTSTGFTTVIVVIVVIGAAHLLTPPPRLGSRTNHLVIALTYVLPALALITCQPGGGVAIGAAIFVGPLTATRLIERRQIAAHYAAASVLFLAVVATGLVDGPTILAVLMLTVTLWVLGSTCAIVLEAAEAQGSELERLTRIDPLTGLGNRRVLDEQLEIELARHSTSGNPLTVVTLDLNGFKALNDSAGHAAGDEVLRAVAAGLRSVTGPADTIIRQGGDEFCILFPATSHADAALIVTAIEASIGRVDAHGIVLTTGIGTATFPADATTATDLLARADHQLRSDKYDSAQAAPEPSRSRGAPPTL